MSSIDSCTHQIICFSDMETNKKSREAVTQSVCQSDFHLISFL